MSQKIPNLILDKLHDDELFIIFSYLDIVELIQTEKVCQRFATVIQQIYKSYKVLDLNRTFMKNRTKLSRLDAKKIATRVGSSVTKLTIGKCWKICEFFNIFTKLETLKLFTSSYDITTFENLSLKTIKNLYWDDMYDYGAWMDNFDFMQVFELEQLEIVKLENFFSLDGQCLKELSNIRVLSLTFCSHINPKHFIEFCTGHPNLRSLTVFGCKWLDAACLSSIAKNLKNLEELSISDEHEDASLKDYLVLAQLTKLKHLGLVSAYKNGEVDRPLQVLLLAISRHNQLTSLELTNLEITNEVKEALKNLTFLQKLHIEPLSSESIWDNSTLDALTCENNLTHLFLNYFDFDQVKHDGVVKLIARYPSIKSVQLYNCGNMNTANFVCEILKHLKERTHMLELEMEDVYFPKRAYGKYFGMNPSKLMLVNRTKVKRRRTHKK